MVGRESGTPCVASPSRYPCAPIDLDREPPVGPGEVETPAPAKVLRERLFLLWFRETRCPDEDEEP